VKPLPAVAMGLVVVLLNVPVHGYDLLADPLGWVLVLIGLSALPVPQQRTVRTLATVSLIVSLPVWVPAARDALNVTDDALAWAAGVTEVLTMIVLAHSLAGVARSSGDAPAGRWLLTARTLFVVVLLIPPVVLGAHLGRLVTAAAVFGSLTLLLMVVLLFRYAGRPWARPADPVPAVRGE
jgi:ABC-type molybdate transport system permease subunit